MGSRANLTNSSESYNSSRELIISFRNLTHKYRALTNMSITNPLLSLQFLNRTLIVQEPSGKVYTLNEDYLLPNITVNNIHIPIAEEDLANLPLP
jgi:hypothetical protein